MENMLQPLLVLLDKLFFTIVSPVFAMLGRGLEVIILGPLQHLGLPVMFQVMTAAFLTAVLSLFIRRLLRVEEKEESFRKYFSARKEEQQTLGLIGDWKSRETLAASIDKEIDEDFNTYLAQRFARYGMTYLMPVFLVLFWLDSVLGETQIFTFPDNRFGVSGLTVYPVFLISYVVCLIVYFRAVKKRRAKAELNQSPVQT